MFYDNPSDTRLRLVLAELWHDWLEAISEVSYQTHRAAESLAERAPHRTHDIIPSPPTGAVKLRERMVRLT